jgi:MFS family permease
LLLFFIKKTDSQPVHLKNNFIALRKVIANPKVLQLFCIWFSFSSVIALTTGQFPIEVKKVFGLGAIGYLTPIFYLLPILFSYYLGKASDIKGRKFFLTAAYVLIIAGLVLLMWQLCGVNKMLFILSFILISLGYAIYAPLRFALMGDASGNVNLESLAAISVIANNLGYVVVFLINLYLPLVLSYLIPLFVIFFSSIIVLPMLRLNKV